MKRILSIALAVALSFTLAPAAESATVKASNGKKCTIVGTAKNDVLKGTSRADVICGLGGNDTITGGAGNDVIDGGAGNDTLKGDAGADVEFGGAGNDSELGGAGNDLLFGAAGNDALSGEAGVDKYSGGLGQNSCSLGEEDKDAQSCQLLSDLGDLVVTVHGQLTGAFQPLVGCYFWAWSSTVDTDLWGSGQVQADGTFEAQGFRGEIYEWRISPLFGEFQDFGSDYLTPNPTCKTVGGIASTHLSSATEAALDSDVTLTIDVPKLSDTEISVKNSVGKMLQGVNVTVRQWVFVGSARLTPNWPECNPRQEEGPSKRWLGLDGCATMSIERKYVSSLKPNHQLLVLDKQFSIIFKATIFSKSISRWFTPNVEPSMIFVIQ